MATKKTFPTLYNRDENGNVREWRIRVDHCERPIGAVYPVIVTTHGVLGGALIEDRDVITEGKNVGKKNETSPTEQAIKEAESKWKKQKSKKGYVESIEGAKNGATGHEGGEKVMLAQKYWDPRTREITGGKRIIYPAAAQPKLDGHRCDAKLVNGKCELWSRGHKLITGVPHINAALEAMFPGMTLDLDGELYNHEYHDNFEELSGFIRSVEPKPGYEVVQYHIYDVINLPVGVCAAPTFAERWKWASENVKPNGSIVLVQTHIVLSHEDAIALFESFLEMGYEGLMLRNTAGLYKGSRSFDLQKVKIFDDAEFVIAAVKEGRGKMKGKAVFCCLRRLPEGGDVEFDAKLKGKLSDLRKYWENAPQYVGEKLTVGFQGFYKSSGKPRFPVALRLKDEVFDGGEDE